MHPQYCVSFWHMIRPQTHGYYTQISFSGLFFINTPLQHDQHSSHSAVFGLNTWQAKLVEAHFAGWHSNSHVIKVNKTLSCAVDLGLILSQVVQYKCKQLSKHMKPVVFQLYFGILVRILLQSYTLSENNTQPLANQS